LIFLFIFDILLKNNNIIIYFGMIYFITKESLNTTYNFA
jgi:hypothetical protein